VRATAGDGDFGGTPSESSTALRPGDRVVVRCAPEAEFSRTPLWSMGRVGRVVRGHGLWPDPDRVARGDKTSEPRLLFQVEFALAGGGLHDLLFADLFEHWLTPADPSHDPGS